MGWRWHEGWFRSEQEIKKIETDRAAGCGFAVLFVVIMLWAAVETFLEWIGLKEPEPKKAKVEKVENAPASTAVKEQPLPPTPEERAVSEPVGPAEPERKPPAPPTPEIERIAHLINASPEQGVRAFLEEFSGNWKAKEPIFFAGEFGQTKRAGLLWRMIIPEKSGDPVSSQYTVEGANEWSKWEQAALDLATVKFDGSEHYYPSIRLSPVLDVAFTSEEEIVLAMTTSPGQEPEIVLMEREQLRESELPQIERPSRVAFREALGIFREGTLDEAKVVVSRLEAAAEQFPEDSNLGVCKEHVLAVFRAEHAIEIASGKTVSADQIVAQKLEEARETARQSGGDISASQAALKLAQQQAAQARVEEEAARQTMRDIVRAAEEYCREVGEEAVPFAEVLQKVKSRPR